MVLIQFVIVFILLGLLADIYTVTAVVGAHTLHVLPARVTEIILGIVLLFVAAKTMLKKNGYTW